jgi:GWxTD domain-containing protein
MGDTREVEERWGSLEGLLSGEAPESAMPLRWRDDAAEALEDAIVRDPNNPAPFLALGRIRKRQGLRVDARRLFERGIDRAESRGDAVPALVAADLYFERGRIVGEDWLPWMNLGQVHANQLGAASCPRAQAPRATGTHVGGGVLIAWNYLCASEFDGVMRDGFESLESLKDGVRSEMLRSFYAAVEVHPAHVEANVAILLDLADARAYQDLLDGAQRFALASGGHPHALLLTDMALHRMGRSSEARTQFDLAFQRLSTDEAEALRDLTPLLGRDAARGLAPVGTREREEVERRFWAPLDPLLATPVNERETEHLSRAAYAQLRFGATTSDAARVWIRYGRPNAMRAVREGAGLRTSFWDYGPGPDITFRRPAASLSYELTSEGKAYVEELMDVFPHRYDAGRGRTLPIVSQTARFRTQGVERLDVEIHARIPEALATGEADSLELGLYLVGPEGERWVVTRSRVAANNAPIHLSATPTATSDRLVLELFHPGSNQAARLESLLSRDGFSETGPGVSDLLLVAPTAPFRPDDGHRASSDVDALVSPSVAHGEQVGVVFELYDLPGRPAGYGLRAQAEHLATGRRVALPLKPAGELEFRTDWNRSRRTGDVVSDYATLDTRRLDRGEYLLRVSIAVESGETLTSTRVVDVR